jgi:hypothetical protein
MAKRRPIPPYLTLPDDTLQAEPADGWELLVDGLPDRVVPDRGDFPSWDSSLRFTLRRRFSFDPNEFRGHLLIPSGRASYQFVVRLETAGGLFSQVVFRQKLALEENVVEVEIAPDSRRLSKDIVLACSVVMEKVNGDVDVLSPSKIGSRVWLQNWSAKLEEGRVRLPIEVISFDKQLHDLLISNAMIYVSVADDLALEFEQSVCVYLNSDHPRFVADFERGERTATGVVWDAILRQTLAAGLSASFYDESESFPENSMGAQLESWMASIFPGESKASIAVTRQQDPAVFEGRIQSWVNASAFWEEAKS